MTIDKRSPESSETSRSGMRSGSQSRSINKAGRWWGHGMSARVLWDVVRAAARRAGIEKLAAHGLRRTCARLRHLAGGEREEAHSALGGYPLLIGASPQPEARSASRNRCLRSSQLRICPHEHPEGSKFGSKGTPFTRFAPRTGRFRLASSGQFDSGVVGAGTLIGTWIVFAPSVRSWTCLSYSGGVTSFGSQGSGFPGAGSSRN